MQCELKVFIQNLAGKSHFKVYAQTHCLYNHIYTKSEIHKLRQSRYRCIKKENNVGNVMKYTLQKSNA